MRIQDDYEAGAQRGARDERGRVATYLLCEAFEYRAEPAKPVAKQGSRLITLFMDPKAMEGARRRQAARRACEAHLEYMGKLAEIGEYPEDDYFDDCFSGEF